MSIIKEAIFIFLDKNSINMTKSNSIAKLIKKFKLSEDKATKYYNEWRNNFIMKRG